MVRGSSEAKAMIGFLKFFSERMRQWVGWVQFAMVAYLTVVTTDVNLMFVLLGVIALLVWTAIDVKFIYPRESTTTFTRMPVWARFERKLDVIEKAVTKK